MREIVLEITVCILQMAVFTIYLKEMLPWKRSVWWMPLCWCALQAAGALAMQWPGNTVVNELVCVLGMCAIAEFLCSGSRKQILFLTVTFYLISLALSILLVGSVMKSGGLDIGTLQTRVAVIYILMIAKQVLMLLLIPPIAHIRKKYGSGRIAFKNWIGILLVSGGSFLVLFLMGLGGIGQDNFSVPQIVMILTLIVVNLLNYYFYRVSVEKNQTEMENQIYENQISLYQEWYRSMQENRKEMRAFQHDMNNHFSVLQELCEAGLAGENSRDCLTEIKAYIQGITMDAAGGQGSIESGNLILDAMLNLKNQQAQEAGIQMNAELQIPVNMGSNPVDQVILFGNLLDNALEACREAREQNHGPQPYISVRIRYAMGNLVITMENSYDGHLDGRQGTPDNGLMLQTTKKKAGTHGIGMQNVRQVVEKYHGTLEWSAKDGVFYLEILLYNAAKYSL